MCFLDYDDFRPHDDSASWSFDEIIWICQFEAGNASRRKIVVFPKNVSANALCSKNIKLGAFGLIFGRLEFRQDNLNPLGRSESPCTLIFLIQISFFIEDIFSLFLWCKKKRDKKNRHRTFVSRGLSSSVEISWIISLRPSSAAGCSRLGPCWVICLEASRHDFEFVSGPRLVAHVRISLVVRLRRSRVHASRRDTLDRLTSN